MIEQTQNIVYGFGPYRVNALRRQILLDGKPVPLTAKAFDTLIVLIGRSGEVVSKDELMVAVWPDTIVEENNLIQQISYLRKLLGERAGDHNYIVTVPGRGYSFVAAVHQVVIDRSIELLLRESAESSISIDTAGEGSNPNWILAVVDQSRMIGYSWAMAFILTVCSPFLWSGMQNPSPSIHPQSLAVLKFRSETGGDQFIGTGISDTLRARLGSVEDLIVRPEPADVGFQDVVAAGRELNVDAVLTGSVQRADERIRVTVEMVDVGKGRVVWGKIFDNSSSNLFELQDSIVGEVARFLHVRFTTKVFEEVPTEFTSFGGSGDLAFLCESFSYFRRPIKYASV